MAIETIRIEGLKGVLDTLRQLPPEVVSKSGGPVKAALRKAALVIQKEAQANVQKIIDAPNVSGETESTGLLKQSIVVARGAKPTSGNGETMLVKIRRNRAYPQQFQGTKGSKVTAAKVGRLLEYGSERRAPMPWLRPAFDAKKNEAVQVFTTEINKRLASIIKKLERQNRVKK